MFAHGQVKRKFRGLEHWHDDKELPLGTGFREIAFQFRQATQGGDKRVRSERVSFRFGITLGQGLRHVLKANLPGTVVALKDSVWINKSHKKLLLRRNRHGSG
jgi:hypothetical protein